MAKKRKIVAPTSTLVAWSEISHELIHAEKMLKEPSKVVPKVSKKLSKVNKLMEIKRFGKVLKFDEFKKDPIGSIRTHLENTLK
jgi:hypothetical protein